MLRRVYTVPLVVNLFRLVYPLGLRLQCFSLLVQGP